MDNLHSTCYVLIAVVSLLAGFILGIMWSDKREL